MRKAVRGLRRENSMFSSSFQDDELYQLIAPPVALRSSTDTNKSSEGDSPCSIKH